MPVPDSTTSIIISVIVAAVSGEVTSTGPPLGLQRRGRAPSRSASARPVGDRLRDGRHLERGRQHLALADRRHARVDRVGEVRRDRARRRVDDLRRLRREELRRLVEAEQLGCLDQLRPAELGAERREHRVARVGEALLEGAAASLVVGVGDLAADVGVGRLDRELLVDRDDPGVERAGGRDHLEGRARAAGARSRRARRGRGRGPCGRRSPRRRRRCRRALRPRCPAPRRRCSCGRRCPRPARWWRGRAPRPARPRRRQAPGAGRLAGRRDAR